MIKNEKITLLKPIRKIVNFNNLIVIKYVDESMQKNFSPAAYMTSAIDDFGVESIYLNPDSVYLKDDEGNVIVSKKKKICVPGEMENILVLEDKIKDIKGKQHLMA